MTSLLRPSYSADDLFLKRQSSTTASNSTQYHAKPVSQSNPDLLRQDDTIIDLGIKPSELIVDHVGLSYGDLYEALQYIWSVGTLSRGSSVKGNMIPTAIEAKATNLMTGSGWEIQDFQISTLQSPSVQCSLLFNKELNAIMNLLPPFNMHEFVASLQQEAPNQFLSLILKLDYGETVGHANCILMTKRGEYLEVERFDPNGDIYTYNNSLSSSVQLDTALKQWFSSPNQSIFRILTQTLQIRYLGMNRINQTAQLHAQSLQERFDGETGLCLVWVVLYMDLRVRNLSATPELLSKFILSHRPANLLSWVRAFHQKMREVVAYTLPVLCTLEISALIESRIQYTHSATLQESTFWTTHLTDKFRNGQISKVELLKVLHAFITKTKHARYLYPTFFKEFLLANNNHDLQTRLVMQTRQHRS